jgi:hypothetical protein
MKPPSIIALGVAAVIGMAWLWHGPLGTGEQLAAGIETRARTMLDHYEMTQVQARVERGPLTRRVILAGPADDFQRGEIKRLVETQPGVGEAQWNAASLPVEATR